MIRRWLRPLAILLSALACAAVAVVLVNLSWFDEPLLPALEALREARPVALEGNGYPLAMGFLAAEGRDPRAAGVEIIQALKARRDRRDPVTLSDDELRAILGTPAANAGLDEILGFKCQARHRLDCADLLLSRGSADLDQPRLVLLFDRYETLLGHAHYVETPDPDLRTPWPPLGPIRALGQLRLAKSYLGDSTAGFLGKAAQELAFWRMVMREGQTLGTKMVALAAIRNAHDFLSALMRDRNLDTAELEVLRSLVRPFSREERDIGAAFAIDARTLLLSGVPPESQDSSWLTRLLLQGNATFNQQFRETIEPMRRRASLDARDYFEQGGHLPLKHEFHLGPRVLYNLGGKLGLSRPIWNPHQFPARVHDEDGRMVLILLQAQVEEHPELDVATVVRTSRHRNPYTGGEMEHDASAQTIRFACLHTAFHPPELADQCAVALGR